MMRRWTPVLWRSKPRPCRLSLTGVVPWQWKTWMRRLTPGHAQQSGRQLIRVRLGITTRSIPSIHSNALAWVLSYQFCASLRFAHPSFPVVEFLPCLRHVELQCCLVWNSLSIDPCEVAPEEWMDKGVSELLICQQSILILCGSC